MTAADRREELEAACLWADRACNRARQRQRLDLIEGSYWGHWGEACKGRATPRRRRREAGQ